MSRKPLAPGALPPPREGIQWGRDAAGRLVGLSRVEGWVRAANGRKAARKSPWRMGFTDASIAASPAFFARKDRR
jgi:hypothetical protein